MSKIIQVRDIPERVHGALKARAAREGMSLSDFVRRELKRLAERPTLEEWLHQTRHARPISGKRASVRIIRGLRDDR